MSRPIRGFNKSTGKSGAVGLTGDAAHVLPGTSGGASAVTTLLAAVLIPGPSASSPFSGGRSTFQAFLSNTTTPTALVNIEVSNNDVAWEILGTLTLSGANDSDGLSADAPWAFVRANVTSISGTSAAVTLLWGR